MMFPQCQYPRVRAGEKTVTRTEEKLYEAREENGRLREAMSDALELLADTDLTAEDRLGNVKLCLAFALKPGEER